MASIATLPALPLPGKPAQFVFTATAAGNLIKVWCTSAPQGSSLRAALDQAQSERVVVIDSSDIGKRPQYTFDVGGAYVLQLEEFTKGAAAYGGRYQNDPDGFRTEERVHSDDVTVYVASLVEAEIGVTPDLATLQLYVSGNNVIATTPATHGFTSPAIVKPKTDKARAAIDAEAVVEALAALGDRSANAVIGALAIDEWISQFNNHIADEAYHANPDLDNSVAHAFLNAGNLQGLVRTLAECRRRLTNHTQNIDPNASSPDPGSANYHQTSGNTVSDWDAALIAAGGSTLVACRILFADLYRCYTDHQSFDGHIATDDAWNLSTAAPLTALHVAFLTEIAALSPTPPANEHPAKVLLVSGAGFKEA